ncbi:MAG: C_GCAxxG_C_C family protein [Clostridiales bacterium]|nr:C_GCAxxG_C_C family protein [Clostridiales bacterium]
MTGGGQQHRPARAGELRQGGLTCSQSVALPYAGACGLTEAQLSALSLPFAGGLHRGDVCGSLCGAYLVIGALLGGRTGDPPQNRAAVAGAMRQLDEGFLQRFGHLRCHDLLGCDPRTPEGADRMRERDLKQAVCLPTVLFCAEFLEALCDGQAPDAQPR